MTRLFFLKGNGTQVGSDSTTIFINSNVSSGFMEKEYYGIYPALERCYLAGQSFLIGIFEMEDVAIRFGTTLKSGFSQVKKLTRDDAEVISGREWFRLEPYQNRGNNGVVWLPEKKQSARYICENGCSMRNVSGEDVVREIGLVECDRKEGELVEKLTG